MGEKNGRMIKMEERWDCQEAGKCFFIELLELHEEHPELSIDQILERIKE